MRILTTALVAGIIAIGQIAPAAAQHATGGGLPLGVYECVPDAGCRPYGEGGEAKGGGGKLGATLAIATGVILLAVIAG